MEDAMSLCAVLDGLARCSVSYGFRLPWKNALAYNLPDLAVTYVMYKVLRGAVLRSKLPQKDFIAAHFSAEILGVLGGRAAGFAAGYFISKAAGYRISPLAMAGLAAPSCVGISGGILLHEYFPKIF